MLYTLNLYNAICLSYLSKTGVRREVYGKEFPEHREEFQVLRNPKKGQISRIIILLLLLLLRLHHHETIGSLMF